MTAGTLVGCDRYCVFQIGGMWFAITATQIREVTPRPELARIPRASDVLAGLWHEGSEFLPVLRLPSRTSRKPSDVVSSGPAHELKTLVLHGPNGPWGLLIDEVHGIESLECSHDAEVYCDDWSTAVMGTSAWQGDVVRILSPDGLYRLAEQILKRTWADWAGLKQPQHS